MSGSYIFVTSADLRATAEAAGLAILIDSDGVGTMADAINEHFEQFILWRAVQGNDAANAEKRDWAGALARACGEVIHALGEENNVALDAKMVLDGGWSRAHQSTDFWLRHHLQRASANPSEHMLPDGSDFDIKAIWWAEIDRLLPMLNATRELAKRAEAAYGSKVKAGGRPPDDVLLLMMCNLAVCYRSMFGALPTISDTKRPSIDAARDTVPGGRALEWFRELFGRAREVCRTALAIPGTDAPRAYAVVGDLCDQVLGVKRGRQTHGRDGLAALIRAASRRVREVEGKEVAEGSNAESRE
ncbi:hypothetical protein D9599_05795 [Roseomonas sp. KE2513]|uniref:hypothetical protein n=1 Tax=Roseomonas sp. KE2513 TaxID=2479202 RepID=UPI0018DF4CE3|nr:hypothetical protein [Roseomonas sp. KE2513]MBI0535085.1 hypothetical protein [Roseomonas sp. KE2513]